MALNPNIILAGRAPDIMGSLMRGQQAAGQQNALRVQNDLTNLYREQGAGIMAGDQNALNALAAIDPMAAMDMRGKQQAYRINEENLKLSYEQSRRAALELAQTMDKAQREAEAARLEQGLAGAAFFYQNKDQAGYENFLRQNDLDPAQYPFEAFPAHAAGIKGAMDALTAFGADDGAPLTQIAKLRADLAANRITQADFEAALADMAPKGMEFVSDGQGGFTLRQGPGVGGGERETSVADAYDPGAARGAIELIDQILATDPNVMSRITGTVMGGGGNDVNDLNVFQRGWYGEEGVAAIERIGQLESRAWLAARAMLKGGGPITDYESRKAEAAVARLSRAKGDAEFKAALTELREAIADGAAKLEAARAGASGMQSPAAGGQQGRTPDFATMDEAEFYSMDLTTLDAEGLQAWIARDNQLKGQK